MLRDPPPPEQLHNTHSVARTRARGRMTPQSTGRVSVVTLTETVIWCEKVSLIVSVHVPAATDVTLIEPLTTPPAVTIPAQPLTVKAPV